VQAFGTSTGSVTSTAQVLDYLLKGMCAVKAIYSSGGIYTSAFPVTSIQPRYYQTTLGGTGLAQLFLYETMGYSPFGGASSAPSFLTGLVTHAVASPTSIVLTLPNRVLPTAFTFPAITLTTNAASTSSFIYQGPYLSDIRQALAQGIATLTVNGATSVSGNPIVVCNPLQLYASSQSGGYFSGSIYPGDNVFYASFNFNYGAKTAKIQDALGNVLLDLLPYGAIGPLQFGQISAALTVPSNFFTEISIPGKYSLVTTSGSVTYSTGISFAPQSAISSPFLPSNVPSSSTSGGTASYVQGQSQTGNYLTCFTLSYNATGVTSIQFVLPPGSNTYYFPSTPTLPYLCGDFAVDCSVQPRTYALLGADYYSSLLFSSPFQAPAILIKTSSFPSGDTQANFAIPNPYAPPSFSLGPSFGQSFGASIPKTVGGSFGASIPKKFKRRH
jgi:hypothetical protein